MPETFISASSAQAGQPAAQQTARWPDIGPAALRGVGGVPQLLMHSVGGGEFPCTPSCSRALPPPATPAGCTAHSATENRSFH